MLKNISEYYIRKKLNFATILVFILTLFLILFCLATVFASKQANLKSFDTNSKAIINEYKLRLKNQFDSDIKTLETLSSFVNNNDFITFDKIFDALQQSNTKIPFTRLGFYYVNGNSYRITLSSSIESNLNFDNLPLELQTIIKSSWNGESSISDIYYDKNIQSNVIAYTVPVYNEGKIIGALSGSKDIKSFNNILNQSSLSNIHLDIDWITNNGEVITWSNQSVISDKIDSIYKNNLFSSNEEYVINKKLQNNEHYKTEMNYLNKSYPIYFEPIGINNWYLIYVDNLNGGKSPIYNLIITITLFVFFIILASIILILWGYKFIRNNNTTLLNLAYYDSLTGSYNFEKFKSELLNLLSEDKNYSLATLNLRDFQYINEIIGSKNADLLLKEISNILKLNIHNKEIFCRSNADQFYILFNSINKVIIKNRLLDIMRSINKLAIDNNINYPITLYSGISITNKTLSYGNLADDLISKAEFAQKHIKKDYKNTLAFYDEEMHKVKNLNNYIESTMENSLIENEFKLFLQPKFNLKTNSIAGAEALVRWIRNNGTIIYPDSFIPTFEKNGFAIQLDLYMVEKACEKIRFWIDNGIKPIPISVNQTKLLFYRSDYVENLCRIVYKYQIPRELITLEVIEGLAVENIDELNKTLRKLHNNGFRISLDDFGSGYSSLNILASIDIDEVKFDRIFLNEKSPNKKRKQKIALRNITNLAKDLNISTVVEGVETKEDLELIKLLGCDYGQGYYYSKPVSSDEFDMIFMKK